MKRALVLSGGGTKGIYQCGAIAALRQLHQDNWDIITGTSVGALNGVMLIQGDFDKMEEMYDRMEPGRIVNGYLPSDFSLTGLFRDRKNVLPALSDYFKNEGLDISPLRELVTDYYDEDRFFASPIQFGCVTAVKNSTRPVYIVKEMMREHGVDWLLATSAAYPAFPVHTIDHVDYVDGGYADNSPIDLALRLGAEEVTVIEMHAKPVHPGYVGREGITIIHPQEELYGLLELDRAKLARAKRLGFLDAKKTFGHLAGLHYCFIPFGLPVGYRAWYRDIMILESQARIDGGRWVSETPVMDALLEASGQSSLNYTQMFFAVLDTLMTIAGLDDTLIWDYDMAVGALRDYYSGTDIEKTGGFSKVKPLIGKTERVTHFMHLLKTDQAEHPDENEPDHSLLQYPFVTALARFLQNVLKIS